MAEVREGIVTRRALLGGLGAGGATLAAGVSTAGAVDATRSAAAAPGSPVAPAGAPPVTSAASPHQPGISYVYRTPFDFQVVEASTMRLGPFGVLPGNEDPANLELSYGLAGMVATIDLPPGALLHDIEWYVYNASGEPVTANAFVWLAGKEPDDPRTEVASGVVPSTQPSDQRLDPLLLEVPPDRTGPWPDGSSLVLWAHFPDSSYRHTLNGARVGFSQAPRQVMMLTDPVRVYDSRNTGGALVPNASRVVPLGAAVPTNATGALVSLSITNPHGAGTLRAGRAGAPPSATALQWSRTGDKVTNLVSTGISAAREMVVQSTFATGSTHIIVEVVGYLV